MDMDAMRTMMETMTKEDQQKDMAEWGTWMKQNMSSFADAGAPVGKNTQVSASGSNQVSNDVGGYSIIQAESMEDASKILESSPHLKMPGAVCDVMELMPMPEM